MLPVDVCFLTLVLAVQRVHSPQPHQAHEQDDRPHDLHEETHLVEGRDDDSQGLSLRGDSASQQEGFCGIRPYVVIKSADSFLLFIYFTKPGFCLCFLSIMYTFKGIKSSVLCQIFILFLF